MQWCFQTSNQIQQHPTRIDSEYYKVSGRTSTNFIMNAVQKDREAKSRRISMPAVPSDPQEC